MRNLPTLLLILLAVVARCSAAFVNESSWSRETLRARMSSDPDAYAAFAETLATTGVFGPAPDHPSAYRPPGYPWAIAPLTLWGDHRLDGIFALHLVLGVLTSLLTVSVGRRMELGWSSWFAGILVAVDPVLARQASLPMTETLSAALSMAIVSAWITPARPGRDALLLGTLVATATLTRPFAALWWLLMGISASAVDGKGRWMRASAVAMLIYAPWIVRNAIVFGAFIPFTTHGGYTLWLGQNPTFFEDVVSGAHDTWPKDRFAQWTLTNTRETRGMSEIESDRHFRDRALRWMRDHPSDALRSMAAHVRSLWSVSSRLGSSSQRWITSAFYGATFLLVAVGLISRRAWSGFSSCLPLALVSMTLLHAIYWSDPRMRAPIAPLLAVLAAVGLNQLQRLRG